MKKIVGAGVRGKRSRLAQGLVEYGLIIGLIAVVCIASLSATGEVINGTTAKTAECLKAAIVQTQGAPVCPICGQTHG